MSAAMNHCTSWMLWCRTSESSKKNGKQKSKGKRTVFVTFPRFHKELYGLEQFGDDVKVYVLYSVEACLSRRWRSIHALKDLGSLLV